MASDIPKWINKNYIQNILQRAESDESIKISCITVKLATAEGENYMSNMYRVGIEYTRIRDNCEIKEKGSLIVKAAPIGDGRGKTVAAFGYFDNETSIMFNTLPKMNQMLNELGMASLNARCLHIQQETPEHLVLDDLTVTGFQLGNRMTGLDLDHCLHAFRNLGRFHASSIALKEKEPEALAKYTKGLMHKDRPSVVAAVYNAGVKILANESRKWNEVDTQIPEKLLKLSKVAFEKGCEAASFREDDFNVLNHGDFWVNNMLFTYNEQGKPIDHIFVDFQISHYGSPAVDILNFFGTSVSDEVREYHREKLVQEYYNSLTSTMVKLKCNTVALSYDELQEVLKRRALCEALAVFVLLPITKLDKSEANCIQDMISDSENEYSNCAYSTKSYRKLITKLLPLYDNMGLLD